MDILFLVFLGTPVWMWALFLTLIAALIAFDLGVLYGKAHEIGVAESLRLSAFYIALAVAFSLFVWLQKGEEAATLYLTAVVVEKSLSLDNIFVIALILNYFAIPRERQHRVLFWGVLGVVLLRGLMIGLGAAFVEQYHWVLYIFAAFLIFTGIKMLFVEDEEYDLSKNSLLMFLKKRFRVTEEIGDGCFFVRRPHPETGRRLLYATPLFLALVLIEFADLIFAVDSIPAVFAITTDAYVVFTSNLFAILGLRALFFALSAILHRFAYLKYALSLLLAFIGSKIFVADLMGWEKFPPLWSLGVTFALLGAGVAYSLWKTSNAAPQSGQPGA